MFLFVKMLLPRGDSFSDHFALGVTGALVDHLQPDQFAAGRVAIGFIAVALAMRREEVALVLLRLRARHDMIERRPPLVIDVIFPTCVWVDHRQRLAAGDAIPVLSFDQVVKQPPLADLVASSVLRPSSEPLGDISQVRRPFHL